MANEQLMADYGNGPEPLRSADVVQRAKDAASAPTELRKYFISKAEIWRRCTEEEAAELYADLRQAPPRLQGIFDGAQYIDTRDDFFAVLQGIVQNRLGVDRAAVVLEPTS